MDSKRRSFLKNTALASLAVSTLPLKTKASSGKEKFKWKMVTAWPKNFPIMGTGANRLAKNIELLSGGRIKVRVYGAGELVPALGVFDAVSRGTVQMGHSASYYWKGKHEATQFFTAVPFGLSALEMNAWLGYGGGQKLWDDLYSDFNLKPFPAGNTSVQMGGWYNKQINSMADFKGLKMRMPGLGGEVLRRVGSTVVTLPGGEIFQSLKSGAIDATEWVGPYNDMAFGLHKAAKWYYWPGWHEPGSTLEAIVNKKAFEKLPQDLQEIVKAACAQEDREMTAEFTARNMVGLNELQTKHKVKIQKFPKEVLTELGLKSKEVVLELANRDKTTKKIYESFNNFRSHSITWGKVSEMGYSEARGLTFS